MKKIIFCAAAALSLFSLFGCHNRAEMQTLVPASAAELKPMQQNWKGVLPCADCEGIETALFLHLGDEPALSGRERAGGVCLLRHLGAYRG